MGLLGGLLGGLVGGIGSVLGANSASQDRKLQKQFAQNQIQWKVQDAIKAGIHPLYALGAPPSMYQPVGDGGVSAGLSQMGQDISRAFSAGADRKQRAAEMAMALQAHELAMRRGSAEIDLIQSEIMRNKASVGPPLPLANDRNGISGLPVPRGALVDRRPMRMNETFPGQPWSEPAPVATTGWQSLEDGGLIRVPSEDYAARATDNEVLEFDWAWRNRVIPWFRGNSGTRPPFAPREGHEWYFDRWRDAWYQRPRRPRQREPFWVPRLRDAFNRSGDRNSGRPRRRPGSSERR